MVTCSSCNRDLNTSQFSKSQRKKGPKRRKCKICIDQNKKKYAVHTENVVMDYFQNLVLKSNELMNDIIAKEIVGFTISSITLDGIYEDIKIEGK